MYELKELARKIPIVRGVMKSPLSGRVWLMKIFACLGFWLVGYLLNVGSSTIAARRFVKGKETLPDFMMDILPDLPFAAADAYFIVWVVFSVFRHIILAENGLVIFLRNFSIYGGVLGTRAFFLNLSLLPDPNPECLFYTPHVQMYGPFELTCSDQMFSGHTALWVILTLCYLRYENSKWMKALGIVGTFIGMLVLVASKAHYTIDVVVGAWVSSSWWLGYYLLTKNVQLPDYKSWPIVNLLEDQLPRENGKEMEDGVKLPPREPSPRGDSAAKDSSSRDPDESRMIMLSTPLSQRQINQQPLLS